MAFNINFWKIDNDKLIEVDKSKLNTEERLENWIERDPSILGIDFLIIGRQVVTEHGGRIDLLGINSQGELIILELKKDKTPREIVSQILDYASWAKTLIKGDGHEIMRFSFGRLGKRIGDRPQSYQDSSLFLS